MELQKLYRKLLIEGGVQRIEGKHQSDYFLCHTLALQNGADIKTVSGMLGHFSAGFTLDTYARVTASAQKEAAATIGQVLQM